MRRSWFTACAPALMCFLLAGSVKMANGADPVVVRVGVPAVYPIYSIFLAAKELGYYSAQGLNVDIITFRGGPASQEALVAGAIELCSQPPRAVALAVDKGVKEHIVALYAPPRPAGWYIMVPTTSTIKTPKDLNGKTVGITQIGSLTDLWVTVAAKAAGVAVTNVPLGGGVLAGTRAKQVDAGILSAPQSYKALAAGDMRVAADLEPLLPPSVSEGVTVSDAFMAQNPDALRRWLSATSKALVYMQTHEAWSVAFLRKYDDDEDDKAASLTYKNFIMKINPDGVMQPAWMKAALELGNTDAAKMPPGPRILNGIYADQELPVVPDTTADEVVALIDRDELIALVLDICNIDSPVGYEGPVAERLHEWLTDEGFAPRRVGLLANRYNLLAGLPGTGGGESLLFNGHMDTTSPNAPDFTHHDPMRDEMHKAWIEDDLLVGDGVVNDKGPICAYLIAAKAIRKSGVRLRGDLLLSAVIAETAHEPCDDAPGVVVDAKELGSRFLATHGGIADHVLVAEGTGFGLVWVEAGKFWFKVTLRSSQPSFYTPYLPVREPGKPSPNMISAAADAITALDRWAAEYETRQTYVCEGGTVVAKAQIGAIRSGDPTRPFSAPQLCYLYMDVRSLPGQDALATREEIAAVLRDAGLDASVELYVFRPGYESQGVDTLVDAVRSSHRAVFGTDPLPAPAATCSMWRDSNVYAELGIPVINYGPRSATHAFRRALTIESLYQAACVYARTAIAICSREKAT